MEAIRVRRCRLPWSRPTPAGNGVVSLKLMGRSLL